MGSGVRIGGGGVGRVGRMVVNYYYYSHNDLRTVSLFFFFVGLYNVPSIANYTRLLTTYLIFPH